MLSWKLYLLAILLIQCNGGGGHQNSSGPSSPSICEVEKRLGQNTEHCRNISDCNNLPASCLKCNYNHSCTYGDILNVTCSPLLNATNCEPEAGFVREAHCRFCHQMDHWLYNCTLRTNCNVHDSPKKRYYTTSCTVSEDVVCLGRRTFQKNLICNWTSGYRWSTALVLSITLGGFGIDRFYLGLWREGIGKLFSFGGLGVWTIIDVILIAASYIGPYDGSLYI